ncbi:MAG: polysulfide reductase NrfD, partial [Candidatus Zixiibacteriota bacterium]
VTFSAERKGIAPPKWIKPIIIISIPWAVSIHTVTAFLYAGLAARPFWLTAILAPRFLASAFAAGPAFLVILCLIMKRFANYDVGREPLKKLGIIITYAMTINIFFVLLEFFTALYSDIPEHLHHFEYLFFGINGANFLVPWMWTSEVLAVVSLILLLVPRFRENGSLLALACVTVIVSLWIDKGLGLVITGFIPSTLGKVTEYIPTAPELMITVAIYAVGFLVLTILYKVAIAVREQIGYK